MPNYEIKSKIKEMGLFQWQVAEKYGISESQFCRVLRNELSKADKQCIQGIIETLYKEKQNENKKSH
ncbi:hypothetical protein [Metabacillus iocasae]|uniref:XRE-type DNA-binding protein n=1 Tax=Priestia iocasae TaxID=2291674 RepID=A0ABS2QTQ2_9BACI|nr:hypothetical protein [Metabacillus iocasae]MBM7702855.1 putative XRE-type DNA-binding protein [Metabacillus iocasae]